ncbi:MAG TPA: tetratricopeptide repeat protein [Methylophilaceae bacterium]|nr:tetratricopeptide repeat protein [Methylophilaceae bacterium]
MPVSRAFLLGFCLLAPLLMPVISQADDLQAIRQQAKQNPDAALKRIDAYLDAKPQDVQALFTKGLILAQQKRNDDAIRIFTEITQKYPALPEPYNNLAVIYANQGHYDKARNALEAALKTNPSYATAHENLGEIYVQMASEAYDKALQLDANNSHAQTKLELISDLATPASKPVMIAVGSELKADTADKPTLAPKTLTATLPIHPAQSKPPVAAPQTKAAAVKVPEVKIAEAKPVQAKSIEPKPAAETSEPEKPKAGEPVKPVAEIKPDLKKPAGDAASAEKEITAAVKQWAKAWSAQDVGKYLASYADDFAPEGGESHSTWEQTRRERVSAPASIRVDLSNLSVKLDGDKTAKVKFRQSYRTGRTTMRTDKVLIMKNIDHKWLIQQELTDR